MAGSFTIAPGDATIWVLPVEGGAEIDGQPSALGDAIIVEGATTIDIAPGSMIYVAYPGVRVIGGLLGSESRSTSAIS